jgi:hypothetical protein
MVWYLSAHEKCRHVQKWEMRLHFRWWMAMTWSRAYLVFSGRWDCSTHQHRKTCLRRFWYCYYEIAIWSMKHYCPCARNSSTIVGSQNCTV